MLSIYDQSTSTRPTASRGFYRHSQGHRCCFLTTKSQRRDVCVLLVWLYNDLHLHSLQQPPFKQTHFKLQTNWILQMLFWDTGGISTMILHISGIYCFFFLTEKPDDNKWDSRDSLTMFFLLLSAYMWLPACFQYKASYSLNQRIRVMAGHRAHVVWVIFLGQAHWHFSEHWWQSCPKMAFQF